MCAHAADSRQELVLTRTFDEKRILVWKAFTEVERLHQWWGPKGFTMRTAMLDFRPGGIFHYSMQSGSGEVLWGRFVYESIDAPRGMTFVNSFSDAHRGITRNPMSPTWPLEVRCMLTLEEIEDKTIVTLRGEPIHATEEERRTFEDGRASMEEGFAGTWDQLDAYLRSL